MKKDLYRSLGFASAKIAQETTAYYDKILKQLDLTSVLMGLMLLIENEPMSQKKIGTWLRIDRTTMVARVNVLEAKGLVERIVNESDKREYQVSLTLEGLKVLELGKELLQNMEDSYLSMLSEVEKEQLTRVLNKILTGEKTDESN